jgi:hypothetical protein
MLLRPDNGNHERACRPLCERIERYDLVRRQRVRDNSGNIWLRHDALSETASNDLEP